jgi:outer membrane protein assembly factor BamB
MSDRSLLVLVVSAAISALAPAVSAQDWPMWGRDETRNMATTVTGLPSDFAPGEFIGTSDEIDPATARNVKWIVKLGSQSYGNVTVANWRVYVGTNNDVPRDPKYKGDRCVVYCLDEKTGDLIWQINIPKLGTGKVSDWEYLGICSSPAVEGDRVWFLSNRCEIVCADVNGLADGNQGFADEATYYADKGEPPVELGPHDGDILWMFNMIDEVGVFPHNITASSVLIAGDLIWALTANGVDYGHVETPAPNAPSMVVVDKNTGALVAEEASGTGARIFHSNWSSPAYWRQGDKELAIFPGPDGVLYAYKPDPVVDDDGFAILDEAWKVDCNPPHYREKEGKPIKYATRYGPSEILGTPLVYDGLIYAVIGQDPEHGEGVGNAVCVDGDGKVVWSYDKINRSLSSGAAADGLYFVPDYSGFVYCFDAKTGALHWRHDTKGHIWGSPLLADGKLYIGNEDGYLTILPAKKELKKDEVVEIDMGAPVLSTPVAANGTLYVQTHTHLFAVQAKDEQAR